jgi:hypothetical protein
MVRTVYLCKRPSSDGTVTTVIRCDLAFEMAADSRRSLMAEEESTKTARVIVTLTTIIFIPSTFVAVRALS